MSVGVAHPVVAPIFYTWNWEDGDSINQDLVGLGPAIDEAEARRRYQDPDGKLFTVVIGYPVVVTVNVRWENNFVGVRYVDERGRFWKASTFGLKDDGRLFMTENVTWHYEADEPNYKAPFTTHWTLKDDGQFTIFERNQREGVVDTKTAEDPLTSEQTAQLWEPVPEFGDWSGICRWDRLSDVDGQPDWLRALFA